MALRDDDKQAIIRMVRRRSGLGEYTALPQSPPELGQPSQQQWLSTVSEAHGVPDGASLFERWRAGYFTILPEDNRLLDLWDVVTILALVSLALALPFEVAFFKESPRGFYLLNRAIDAIFVIDILVTFQVAYSVSDALSNEMYEREPIKIAKHYMATPCSSNFTAGWFWPDILTVLPWDWLGVSSIRFVRVLRLLRMMRLVRVIKLCHRWHSRVGTSYAVFNIAKCALLVLMALHWLTCVWGFMAVSALGAGGQTWLRTYSRVVEEDIEDYGVSEVYNIAMYFCAMTLTGVGYGDVSPSGQSEIWLSTVTMFVTGFIWAWVIATIVNVVNNLDAFATQFQQINDELNKVMESRGLSASLRSRCRKHLHEAYLVHRKKHDQLTIRSLSTGLQGEIHIASGADRICNCVWYLQDLEPEVLVELVNYFNPDMFSPGESIVLKRCVAVLRRGCVWWKGRGLTRDDVIGEDMILDSELLRETIFPKTLTFVELMLLHRDDLQSVCERYPVFSRKIRMAQVRLAIRRGILYYRRLARIRQAFQGPLTAEGAPRPREDPAESEAKKMRRPQFSTANDHQCELMTAVTSLTEVFQHHIQDTKQCASRSSGASAATGSNGGPGCAAGTGVVDGAGGGGSGPAAWEENAALSAQLARVESVQSQLLDQLSGRRQQDAALSARLASIESTQTQLLDRLSSKVLPDAAASRETDLDTRLARIEAVQVQLLDCARAPPAGRGAQESQCSTRCGSGTSAESPVSSCKAQTPPPFFEFFRASAVGSCAACAGAGTSGGLPLDVSGADFASASSRQRELAAAAAAAAVEQPRRLDFEARLAAMEKGMGQRHQHLQSIEAALSLSRGPPAAVEAPAGQRALGETSGGCLAGRLGAGRSQLADVVGDSVCGFEASWRGRLEARLEAQMQALQESAITTVKRHSEALDARLHAQLAGLGAELLGRPGPAAGRLERRQPWGLGAPSA